MGIRGFLPHRGLLRENLKTQSKDDFFFFSLPHSHQAATVTCRGFAVFCLLVFIPKNPFEMSGNPKNLSQKVEQTFCFLGAKLENVEPATGVGKSWSGSKAENFCPGSWAPKSHPVSTIWGCVRSKHRNQQGVGSASSSHKQFCKYCSERRTGFAAGWSLPGGFVLAQIWCCCPSPGDQGVLLLSNSLLTAFTDRAREAQW